MDAILTSSLGRTILDNSVVTIGRASDNKLVVSDPTVSAHHAEIRPDRPGYSLVDLGSTNGTFVNQVRLTRDLPHKLRPGDICYVGNFTFIYEEHPSSQPDDFSKLPAYTDEEAYGVTRAPNFEDQPAQKGFPGFTQGATPPASAGIHSTNPPAPSPSPPDRKYLQFAAFHPRAVPVETWNTLLVYAYIESALQSVRTDARMFKAQLGSDPFQVDAWASHPLARGEQITIVPTFEGVTFNPERMTFAWIADWHRAFFSFNADRRWAGAVGSGEILVFSGPRQKSSQACILSTMNYPN